MKPEKETKAGFEPKIVGFLCNWCGYAGADLAGVSRIQYPPNIRVIRTMCSARVNPLFILKALTRGIVPLYEGELLYPAAGHRSEASA